MKTEGEEIFVQIPSYRDTQLVHTIESLLANASNNKRLRISICWQHAASEKLPKSIRERKNIEIIDIDFRASKGANWARSIVQKNWNHEPYTLLIDSHMRFAKDWDRKLIDMILLLKEKNAKKPIISGYPPHFLDPHSYPLNRSNYPLKMYPQEYEFNLLTKFYALPIPLYKWLKSPIEAQFLAMGFLFADGFFNQEIPFDPKIYFFGDDITTGLRAYCHGYKLYHPHRPVAWHLYDRKTRTLHWNDHKNWRSLNEKSYKRLYHILKGEDIDGFSLGSEKSVTDYEAYIGCKLIANE